MNRAGCCKLEKGIKILFIPVSLFLVLGTFGCRSNQAEITDAQIVEVKQGGITIKAQIVEVKRGDISVSVPAEGNLVMPREARLSFGTEGTVVEVLVEEGDVVKEGTLLARLDSESQRIAIEKSLYDLQKTINNLAERASCVVTPDFLPQNIIDAINSPGSCKRKLFYPHRYPNASALLMFNQAQKDLKEAEDFLEGDNYKEAVSRLRMTYYDLEICLDLLKAIVANLEAEDNDAATDGSDEVCDLECYMEAYPGTREAIGLLQQSQQRVANSRDLIQLGSYGNAIEALDIAQQQLVETRGAVKTCVGQIERFHLTYADSPTSLDFQQMAYSSLKQVQKLAKQPEHDQLKIAQILHLVQADMDIASDVLQNNTLVFEAGLNFIEQQQYNISIHKALVTLQKYKEELMKTEILAPFDSTVVDVGVKVKDELSSYDYSSVTAVHLVDTGTVKFDGEVNEIDVYQVKEEQKAKILVDALPDRPLWGKVRFISPFGTAETGVVIFDITIDLEPIDIALTGGLTATAEIIAEDRKDVLLVPVEAVIKLPAGNLILVHKAEGEPPDRRMVAVGIQTFEFAEVTSGLSEGEKVMIIDRETLMKMMQQRMQGAASQ